MSAKPSQTARKSARKSVRKSGKRKATAVPLPPAADWRTTDQDEILRRVQRARDEKHTVSNLNPEHPVFSNFRVASPSGMDYQTEIRDLDNRVFACSCPDFRINGLGTCKHIEATLIWLKRRRKGEFRLARQTGSRRIDLVPGTDTLSIERNFAQLPASLKPHFDSSGTLTGDPAAVVAKAARFRWFRVSQEVAPFIESRRRAVERRELRRDYETGVVEGRHPEHVTLCPLYPYQREGMLHLAFGERALLADEMGLGKTIQAIAACALLHHLGKARRVLIVTPASLKAEWEEQIRRFTSLTPRLIYGPRAVRARYYADPDPPFFTIVNYEQVVSDSLDINARLQPDIVVLDEAQRIKNWATKTAQAVKRLQSRYAFVLTGTPIENRIDETTWAAVQQLAAAGLVTFNTRATRALVGTPSATLPTHTPEQLERIASLKTFAARKEKAATLLEAADLAEEAEPHRHAAAKAMAAARAIENHQPEPDAGPIG